jgi:hexosaminidase
VWFASGVVKIKRSAPESSFASDMHKTILLMAVICLMLVVTVQGHAQTDAANTVTGAGVNIVPLPKSLILGTKRIPLGDRIIPESPELRPLAQIVSEEIEKLTGKRLTVEKRTAHTGDIVLRLAPGLKGEAYTIEVKRAATVRGGNYAAVAQGTVSLLQALDLAGSQPGWPQMSVKDEPVANYRGLMIDAARQWHSVGALKQLIEMCRWYKIHEFQIHFTDGQSFTFPSTAFPKLPTPGRHYSVEDLKDLEAFARDRGVGIVPELETPGHASAIVKQMPEIFADDPPSEGVICPSREEAYRGLDTLVGEMTDIFRTTPYFHIGADEVGMDPWKKCKYCQAYMAAHNLDDVNELYRHFIVRMDEIVKKHGKKTIVWEGFHKDGKTEIPRDVTVMVFESLYNIAPDVVAQGYSVINTSWKPLYVVNNRNWTPEYIYGWNMYRWENWWDASKAFKHPITVDPTPLVLGAEMCAWEQAEKTEVPSLRQRLPAMSERLWNPGDGRDYQDFAARLNTTDASLTKLLP